MIDFFHDDIISVKFLELDVGRDAISFSLPVVYIKELETVEDFWGYASGSLTVCMMLRLTSSSIFLLRATIFLPTFLFGIGLIRVCVWEVMYAYASPQSTYTYFTITCLFF